MVLAGARSGLAGWGGVRVLDGRASGHLLRAVMGPPRLRFPHFSPALPEEVVTSDPRFGTKAVPGAVGVCVPETMPGLPSEECVSSWALPSSGHTLYPAHLGCDGTPAWTLCLTPVALQLAAPWSWNVLWVGNVEAPGLVHSCPVPHCYGGKQHPELGCREGRCKSLPTPHGPLHYISLGDRSSVLRQKPGSEERGRWHPQVEYPSQAMLLGILEWWQ